MVLEGQGMTTKEKVLGEITKISEEEPILQEILELIATRKNNVRRVTSNGRVIRMQTELENTDCPYPYEADL